MNTRYRALSSAIFAVLAMGTAYAEDAPATAPATAADAAPAASQKSQDQKSQALDTVQVTATKRSTSLQKTPVAVSALSADTLQKERINNVADITKLVPGFAATTEGDHGVITLTLRGIGNDSAKTEYADPEVALFVDGVYTPRAEAAAGLLLDLESVEVLRGPQGTLWGRNSTVGAVNFQTAKPELGPFYGYAQFEAGDYSHLGMRAAVNVPVSDTFAFRVAIAQEQHDGYVDFQNPIGQLPSVASQQAAYITSGGTLATFKPIDPNLYVTKGQKYNSQDQSAARISTLWTPSDKLTWNLSFEYFRDRGTPNANLMQQPRAGQDFWSALVDTAPQLDRNSYALRSRVDYAINDGMELSYIAGFSKFNGSSDYDQDGGVQVPTSFASGANFQDDRTNDSRYKSSSHELDLKSTGDNTIDWILGLYYASEDNSIRFDIPIFNGTSQGTVGWQGSFIQPKETVDSYAGFGQMTWHLSDSLRLTGGARWTHDEKENDGGRNYGWAYDATVPQVPISTGTQPGPTSGFAVSAKNDGKYSSSKPTWLLRADMDLSSNALLYGSVSTGYKSGGLQDGGVPYKGESILNYEAGIKLTFLDHHLTWNTAVYHEDFKNFQLSAPITFVDGSHGLGFSNVEGTTKVTGIESELAAVLSDADRLNVVVSVIPQKKLGTLIYAGSNDYGGLPACAPASGIGNCLNVSGNDLAHAPDTSFSVIYEHKFSLSNGGALTPRFSGHYETASWLSPFNLGNGDQQGSYFRGDLMMRYTPADEKWWAGVYVNNFTDVKVRTNAGRTALGNNQFIYTSQYLAPRTFGMNFGVSF
ncbi:TonB-dependent receptor [Pseudolysobacter antarcticus]|uniref:TonB-dependent receptor n=1 Tax=Pseudolysobacter antarcticus TaxID=2511995 RepID=A0A411HGV1_9GAMM|nr:TonB-dependent receptor [Pseudolysobacter antarcticus]QBB69728.1 TonB-dependent receptor [Pseudolysobacter antarcticus]